MIGKELIDTVCSQFAIDRHGIHGIHHDEPTVAICCDSDRLDLARVGNKPDPQLLNTAMAKDRRTINWAVKRSTADYLPKNVLGNYLCRKNRVQTNRYST